MAALCPEFLTHRSKVSFKEELLLDSTDRIGPSCVSCREHMAKRELLSRSIEVQYVGFILVTFINETCRKKKAKRWIRHRLRLIWPASFPTLSSGIYDRRGACRRGGWFAAPVSGRLSISKTSPKSNTGIYPGFIRSLKIRARACGDLCTMSVGPKSWNPGPCRLS